MGGGPDVAAAFAWQRDRIDGGDVVVLRASGADGYNGYLFDDIGGVDSVETLLVDSVALAGDPHVRWTLDHAEAIFLAGGDQAVYVAAWRDSPVAAALGTIYSDEALADPYDLRMTLERGFVGLPPLVGVITDTHFGALDRMGRLLAFTGRAYRDGWAAPPLGIGVDEGTALVVDDAGLATVLGAAAVYVLAADHQPTTCAQGAPLAWSDVALRELRAGDSIALPSGDTAVPARSLSAGDGALDPADPY